MAERPETGVGAVPTWPFFLIVAVSILPVIASSLGMDLGYHAAGPLPGQSVANLVAAVQQHAFLESLCAGVSILGFLLALAYHRGTGDAGVLLLGVGLFWAGAFHAAHGILPA